MPSGGVDDQHAQAVKDWATRHLQGMDLAEWLRRSKLNKGSAQNLQASGSAGGGTLSALAKGAEENPVVVFKLAGWLTDEDVEPPKLTPDEKELVALYQEFPEVRVATLGGLRAQKAAKQRAR